MLVELRKQVVIKMALAICFIPGAPGLCASGGVCLSAAKCPKASLAAIVSLQQRQFDVVHRPD